MSTPFSGKRESTASSPISEQHAVHEPALLNPSQTTPALQRESVHLQSEQLTTPYHRQSAVESNSESTDAAFLSGSMMATTVAPGVTEPSVPRGEVPQTYDHLSTIHYARRGIERVPLASTTAARHQRYGPSPPVPTSFVSFQEHEDDSRVPNTPFTSRERLAIPIEDDRMPLLSNQVDSRFFAGRSNNQKSLRRETRKIDKDSISGPVLNSTTNSAINVPRQTSDTIFENKVHPQNMPQNMKKSTTVPNLVTDRSPWIQAMAGPSNLVGHIKNSSIVRKVIDAKDSIMDLRSYSKARSGGESRFFSESDTILSGQTSGNPVPRPAGHVGAQEQQNSAMFQESSYSSRKLNLAPIHTSAPKKLGLLSSSSGLPTEIEDSPKLQQFFGTNETSSPRRTRHFDTEDIGMREGSPSRQHSFQDYSGHGTGSSGFQEWEMIDKGEGRHRLGSNLTNSEAVMSDGVRSKSLGKGKEKDTSQADFSGFDFFPGRSTRPEPEDGSQATCSSQPKPKSGAKTTSSAVDFHPSVYGIGETPELQPSFVTTMSPLRGNTQVTAFAGPSKQSSSSHPNPVQATKADTTIPSGALGVEIHPSYYGKTAVPRLNPAFDTITSPLRRLPNVMEFAEAPDRVKIPEDSPEHKRGGMILAKSPVKRISSDRYEFMPGRYKEYRDSTASQISHDSAYRTPPKHMNTEQSAVDLQRASGNPSQQNSTNINGESVVNEKLSEGHEASAEDADVPTEQDHSGLDGAFDDVPETSDGIIPSQDNTGTASYSSLVRAALDVGARAAFWRSRENTRLTLAQAAAEATEVTRPDSAASWMRQIDEMFQPTLSYRIRPAYEEPDDDSDTDSGDD